MIHWFDQHNIFVEMMYWHRAWSMSMTSCFTWRMLYHADSKTIIYLLQLQRRQKTFSATSSSASNVIIPHSKTRRTQVQPLDPSGREPFAAAKYNHQASAPASPILHPSKFKRLMAAFVLRTSAIACKKKAVIQPKWKHPSTHCSKKSDTVNVGQCLSGPKPQSTHLKYVHRPRPLHHRIAGCAPNWCQPPCYLTSRLWLRPDHEMHSESNLDARNNRVNSSLQKRISGAAIPQSKMDTTLTS